MMLEYGADKDLGNLNDEVNETPLMLVARCGNLKCLMVLLEYNADVNKQDKNGNTALMKAVRGGHTDCARELIRHGADVHACTFNARTQAMHYAALEGQTECIQLLVEHGADLNAEKLDGTRAEDLVRDRAHRSKEFRRCLEAIQEMQDRNFQPQLEFATKQDVDQPFSDSVPCQDPSPFPSSPLHMFWQRQPLP